MIANKYGIFVYVISTSQKKKLKNKTKVSPNLTLYLSITKGIVVFTETKAVLIISQFELRILTFRVGGKR